MAMDESVGPGSTGELLYLLSGDPAELVEAASRLRPADVVESLNDLPASASARVIAELPLDMATALFDEPEFDAKAAVFEQLPEPVKPQIFEALSADQQADLMREMPQAAQRRLLPRLDAGTREALTLLLRYPTDTAGGIMTTEYASVPVDWTVEQALRHVGLVGPGKETIYAIYVLDAERRLVHVISLRQLMATPRHVVVRDVGDRRPPITVTPETDREDTARLIRKYNLLAIPVIDADRHVLGIVTVDDVIDALIEEETEDIHKMGGTEAFDEPYLSIRISKMIRKRGGWLAALFLGEMLTATAMGHFEAEIAQAVVLALFVPLIISSGGNSGSQATTLVIRAMALGDVTGRDWWRVARRELMTGLALGAILGAIGFARILTWQAVGHVYGPHYLLIAATVAFSLVGVVLWGSLTGSMLPFVLRRMGFDPASASAPFVATVVDVTGLVIYFSVASVILRGSLL
jgi:magnesium transporter